MTMPAFLPREKPISRKAKPACMKNTRTVATITQVRSRLPEDQARCRLFVLSEGQCRKHEGREQAEWHRSHQSC